MSESAARDYMRKKCAEALPHLHWQRIESPIMPGIPDINLCWNGQETWVEAKYLLDFPKRMGTLVKLKLQPEQRLWLESRQYAGGRALVAAKVGNEWFIFNRGFKQLVNGCVQSEFRQLAVFSGKVFDPMWMVI